MLSKVLLAAFFARQDTRTPMRAAIATVVANIVLTIALVMPLVRIAHPSPHLGIALATALAGVINAWLLARALRRAGIHRREPGWGRHLLRVGVGTILLALVVTWLRLHVGDWGLLPPAQRWLWLGVTIAAGAGCYGFGLLVCGWRPRMLREHG
jgi:putative peptidoglycan lipid II flippase